MLNWKKMTSCWPNDEVETREKIDYVTIENQCNYLNISVYFQVHVNVLIIEID
jgi:hypothetical protein